jgi:RNA-directed DNA polymerase
MRSRSAKSLAVRRVTQDNQGKKTAGVDGVKALTPSQRISLVHTLTVGTKGKPVRRVWIPKPGSEEKRPLGIPTIHDRALQTLVKLALEPEWEAKFEPNSYGFRPGRSCHDAIEMIFTSIAHKAKYVLDADIAKCFDRINHRALLEKLRTTPELRRQIKAWLKSGVIDNGTLFPTEQGTMQGGTISPLLANVALHGMEKLITEKFPTKTHRKFYAPQVVRYADDLVVLHEDLSVVQQCRESLAEWLKDIGLELKPSKTRIAHTLNEVDGVTGFDFLGFNVRQYPVAKAKSGKDNKGERLGFKTLIKPSGKSIQRHISQLGELAKSLRNQDQKLLIKKLNPVIIGWSRYYSTVVSQATFDKVEYVLYSILAAWANFRHPNKSKWWVADKYWNIVKGKGWTFQSPDGDTRMYRHETTPIRRHVKVQGQRSPYDGDWLYWSSRLGKHPEIPLRVATLLKRQRGKCAECRLFFKDADIMEVDHILPKRWGGGDSRNNLQLLHRHCHNLKTARENDLTAE